MAEEQNRALNDKFMLRLPDGMRDQIKVAAEANNRSMNTEIIATLEAAYMPPLPDRPKDPAARVLLWLAKRIRGRNPKPGSARARQADFYESLARQALSRANEIGGQGRDD